MYVLLFGVGLVGVCLLFGFRFVQCINLCYCRDRENDPAKSTSSKGDRKNGHQQPQQGRLSKG